MIPVSYTYDTFADYLLNEVLMSAAFELGWIDTVDVIDPYETVDVVGIGEIRMGDGRLVSVHEGTSSIKNILPSLHDVPAGTKVNHLSIYGTWSGSIRTLLNDVKKGDKTATFTASFSSAKGEQFGFYNAPRRQRNPIYTAIIDEVLLKLEVTDITSITGKERLKQLRMYGRREAWRVAMQSITADYNYETDTGMSGRREVYEHCKRTFWDEDARINFLYGEVLNNADTGEMRVSATGSKIKPRW